MTADGPLDVVVAGGGPAALEAVMALRDLAGDQVRLTLVASEAAFELKAFRSAEPFAAGHVPARSMRALAERLGAGLRHDAVTSVDAEQRALELASGDRLAYDMLVLAVGARPRPAPTHAITAGAEPRGDRLWLMLREIGSGVVRSVAFVVPSRTTWPLPLYEIALMTAQEGARHGVRDLRLEMISPESAPLGVFGPEASRAVAALLEQARVTFTGPARTEIPRPGTILLSPSGEQRYADRIVSLPALDGPAVPGVPADENGFIPVDAHGRVEGVDRVYAAGDATDFPVKQGGLACQQADAVAEHIAAHVVAGLEPRPFRAVLRAKLLTGRGGAHLRLGPGGGGDAGEVADTKVNGRYLSPWLLRDEVTVPPAGSAPGR